MRLLKPIISATLLLAYLSGNAQTLSLKFTNVRSKEGFFRVGFFTDEGSYKSGDPKYYVSVSKNSLKDGQLICMLDTIQPGTYGIAVLDDENGNDKTDYSFILFPKEGFGLSNYPITKVEIPRFDDFKFNYLGNELVVEIRMKYL